MSYQHTFALVSMKDDAEKQFRSAKERLNKQSSVLNERLGDNSYGTIIGSIFFTLVWAAIFVAASTMMPNSIQTELRWMLLGLSVLLPVLMLLREILMLRYYGGLLSAKSKIDHLIRQITEANSDLTGNLTRWHDGKKTGWKVALPVKRSVIAETEQVDAQLAGMQAVCTAGAVYHLMHWRYREDLLHAREHIDHLLHMLDEKEV